MEEKLKFTVKKRLKITDDTFKIITCENYLNLKRYNYNVKQLKTICRHYKLPIKGNKPDIQLRIYNYLKCYKYATTIQKYWRGYLTRKINKLRGLNNFKRECCNSQDFVTLEEIKNIPYLQYFSFVHNGKNYGFDVISIYDYIVKRKNKENPYDRTVFSSLIKSNLLKLKKLTKITKQNTIFENVIETNVINIYEIFNKIDQLGNYSDVSWYTSLNYSSLMKFYRELYDIWIYRANLTYDTKFKISKYDPFNNVKPFFFENYSIEELNNILLIVMKKFLYYAINDEYQNLGAMYILTALTIVSPGAAEAMPWYFSSVI